MKNEFARTRDEVTAWFFDDYVPTWVAVGAGQHAGDSDFILKYWSAPLHVCSTEVNAWFPDGKSVVDLLEFAHRPLKEGGYTHTVIPDRRVDVYHDNGAAIEVIWSRRRADESEIERMATHFELARTGDSWRIVGIQVIRTTLDRLNDVWPRTA